MHRIIISILVLITIVSAQTDTTFIEIIKLNPKIQLDLRYATTNNFLNEKVYPDARCFLRAPAAKALNAIQKELESIGLGLVVFDGYRPLSVQKKMWELLPDRRYVADPKKGSRHNRGMAVDVSLLDANGKPLDMPTPFDSFEQEAHQDFMKLPNQLKLNRWILKTIMEKHGFSAISSEWWHYDYKGWKKYNVLDAAFDEL